MAQPVRVCAICRKRRPRRFCPGVRGDICPICCGTEREVTVNCPLDCTYLQEARRHEALVEVSVIPNADVRVDESFLHRHERLVIFTGAVLAEAALETDDAVDRDLREALSALVRTYRTIQSGLVYESRPDNPIAARIFGIFQARIDELRPVAARRGDPVRDSDLLIVLVFFERMSVHHDNGRPKGRSFIDALRSFIIPDEGAGEGLVSPDTSLIELP